MMKCCHRKRKHKKKQLRSNSSMSTAVNQEYYDFVEACSNIADESLKDSNASGLLKLHAHVARASIVDVTPPFLEKNINVIEETYHGKQIFAKPGVWKKYDANEFQMIKINISRGSTSKIHLVMHKKSGFIGIMKVIPPTKMAEARTELNVLASARDSPFIIRLMDAFLCENYYIFMEFAPFRTLDHLTQAVRGLGSDLARLYAMEMTCALRFLHDKNIMHRDIKPENVLILLSGHVALADLGSSIQMDGKTITTAACGTYVTRPPEVWNGEPYTLSVDIWQLGMTLYNVMSNTWPIVHPSRDKQISLVNNGKIVFTEHFKESASDLISKMLQVQPLRRMSCKQILKHEYFEPLREPFNPPFSTQHLFQMYDFGDEERIIRALIGRLESPAPSPH